MKEITIAELKKKLKSSDFFLLDVREFIERNQFNIGGKWIPINEIPSRMKELPDQNTEIIIYCRSGIRSAHVTHYLNQKGYSNVFNLKGGLIDWKDE